MWNTKYNYQRNELDATCPPCRTEEDTIEHIMVCQEGNNTYDLLDENKRDQGKIVTLYKNNKIGKNQNNKKCKRKRYTTIEGQENTMGKSKN